MSGKTINFKSHIDCIVAKAGLYYKNMQGIYSSIYVTVINCVESRFCDACTAKISALYARIFIETGISLYDFLHIRTVACWIDIYGSVDVKKSELVDIFVFDLLTGRVSASLLEQFHFTVPAR